ncbi:hypothetical protein AN191_11400 [Loktanella sp. 5RATIMAR09]|uniref:hypothetical protein n=1 Tax=Loktanella sp. 5RATIMAR09 TaxID=1225655 RepID=UPI0006EBC3DC|nr:hypothetical protein [Loktanella sp. 5RATIMAR09]KQI71589.1 hypothetical protein AN191_11400 [Loktanella sp. 5RATIMAR09]
MSETFQVSATEHGVIRIFMVNLTADEAARFAENPDGATPAPINRALGVDALDHAFVELVALKNLDGVGLAGYLVEGLGVAEADVAPYRSRLNGMSGHVLIVSSKAFGGRAATIGPVAPLKWIGTYTEEGASVKFEPLPSKGAEGNVASPTTKAPKSDARIGGMIAMYALIAMFSLVGLMIWVAG